MSLLSHRSAAAHTRHWKYVATPGVRAETLGIVRLGPSLQCRTARSSCVLLPSIIVPRRADVLSRDRLDATGEFVREGWGQGSHVLENVWFVSHLSKVHVGRQASSQGSSGKVLKRERASTEQLAALRLLTALLPFSRSRQCPISSLMHSLESVA